MTEIDGVRQLLSGTVEEREMRSFRPEGNRAAGSAADNYGFVS